LIHFYKRMSKADDDNSLIVASGELIKDLGSAYEQGLVNDITFTFPDGGKLCANKTLLAVRSDFFASMFFGGFKDMYESEIEFKSCNSEVFKQILDYLWIGNIDLKTLSLQVLLNLMETSRLLCLDTLYTGIENFIILKIDGSSFNHDEWLEALDFAVLNKFDNLSACVLLNVDKSFDKVVESPRFKTLTESSILSILMHETRTFEETYVFKAFLIWMENKENLDVEVKSRMVETFDLKKFSKSFLLSSVRKTGYFSEAAILDVLEVKVADAMQKYEDTISQLHHTQVGLQNVQSELVSTLCELQDSEAELQNVRSQLLKVITGVKGELRDTKLELQNVRSQHSSIQVESILAQSKLRRTESDLQKSKEELKDVQSQLEDAQKNLQGSRASFQNVQSHLNTTRYDLQQSHSAFQTVQSQLANTQYELHSTQAALQNAQMELQNLRGRRSRRGYHNWY